MTVIHKRENKTRIKHEEVLNSDVLSISKSKSIGYYFGMNVKFIHPNNLCYNQCIVCMERNNTYRNFYKIIYSQTMYMAASFLLPHLPLIEVIRFPTNLSSNTARIDGAFEGSPTRLFLETIPKNKSKSFIL